QEVKSGELTQAGQMNLTGSLTGKIAGVQINQFGGTVGASSRITIRGNSSFASDQQPLFVVDGVPISNDTQRTGDNTYEGVDYGSGINDINPEDIESITVLKGGSAALYGMRAGRGVILITTKKGTVARSGVTVSYDANLTLSNATNLAKMQNRYGQGYEGDEMYWKLNGNGMSYQQYAETYGFNFQEEINVTDESWGPRLDIGLMLPQFDSPNTNGVYQATPWVSRPNNLRDFFQTGSMMNHTISVASTSEKADTRVSLSYRSQVGTTPQTEQQRYTGQFSTKLALNQQFSVEMMGNYTHTTTPNTLQQGYDAGNPINGMFNWSGRQINMQSLKDNWDQKDASGNYTHYNWMNAYHMNPYFIVNKNTNSMVRDRLFGKASIFYKPFEFLTIEGRMGFDFFQTENIERVFFHWDFPEGKFDKRNTKNTELNLDLLATFNKQFGDFSLNATVGANYRDVVWSNSLIGASQLTVPGVYTIANKMGDALVEMDHSHIRSNSVFGAASIGWKSQLFLDVSARNDWSSTILDPFFYPGASISWMPTESFDFMKNDVLSFLKLRFGLAQIGAATSAYRNRAYYFPESSAFGGVSQMYRSMTMPSAHLRPEKILTWEPGIELGLFDNRLYLDFTYYQKITTDQILSVPTDNTIGFTSFQLNAGRIDSKGIEIQLRGDILRNSTGLNWTSTVNFTHNTNKVVELAPEYPQLLAVQLGWSWGIPSRALVGEDWGVLQASGYDRVTEADIKAGIVGAGAQLGDIKLTDKGLARSRTGQIIGRVSPKFLAGLRNEFSYKNLSAGFFVDMRIGGDIWSQSMDHSFYAGTAAITAENGIRERMLLPGKDVQKGDRFVMQESVEVDGKSVPGKWVPNTIEVTAQDWFSTYPAERNVFDGSFVKLREIYLSYNIPSSIVAKTGFISRANVSLIGSNLWLIYVHKSNILRLDPETGGVSSDSRGVGFEQSATPSSRDIGIKLGLTF
ncbi:MAG: SusC/RagA family TonB-linked outer membrane protein, partial [Tannerella sp.]|nr:SusC/RagA family TonB-linked outer membrane protein [Tannerella sp.]